MLQMAGVLARPRSDKVNSDWGSGSGTFSEVPGTKRIGIVVAVVVSSIGETVFKIGKAETFLRLFSWVASVT
jgi:hypothetical protein